MKGKQRGNEKTGPKSGRIGRIDQDTFSYYRRVSNTLEEGFEDDEEKELFMNNVFNQMKEDWFKICQNQTVSHILEKALQHANKHHLQGILETCSRNWELMCTDRFASHIMQTLLLQVARYVYITDQQTESERDADDALMHQNFYALCRHLEVNIGASMQHTYASHVLRNLCEVLAGVRVSQSVIRSKLSRTHQSKRMEKENEELHDLPVNPTHSRQILHNLSKRIMALPRLTDYATNALSGPVLQTFILALKEVDQGWTEEFINKLIQETSMFAFQERVDQLPSIMTDETGSYLVEQVLQALSPDAFQEIFQEHLNDAALFMASHPASQYVAMRLIECVHTKNQFESLFKKLSRQMEHLLSLYHVGVVVKLAEGCNKHGCKQDKFIKALQKAFHCYEPAERQSKLVPLLASLTSYDVFYKLPDSGGEDDESDSDKEESEELKLPQLRSINMHGSLILQQLFKFTNARQIVSSLLELKPGEIQNMACDPKGNHILEAFLKCDSTGEKTRDKFIAKIEKVLPEIACDKNGSRTIDALWEVATMTQKTSIAAKLAKHEHRVEGDQYGRFLWRNLGLGHFLRNQQEWRNQQTNQQRKRKLFTNILQDKPAPAIKAKKKKWKETQTPGKQVGAETDSKKSSEVDPKSQRMYDNVNNVDPPNTSELADPPKKKKKQKHEKFATEIEAVVNPSQADDDERITKREGRVADQVESKHTSQSADPLKKKKKKRRHEKDVSAVGHVENTSQPGEYEEKTNKKGRLTDILENADTTQSAGSPKKKKQKHEKVAADIDNDRNTAQPDKCGSQIKAKEKKRKETHMQEPTQYKSQGHGQGMGARRKALEHPKPLSGAGREKAARLTWAPITQMLTRTHQP